MADVYVLTHPLNVVHFVQRQLKAVDNEQFHELNILLILKCSLVLPETLLYHVFAHFLQKNERKADCKIII